MEQEYKWIIPDELDTEKLLKSSLIFNSITEQKEITMKAIYYDTGDHLFSSLRGGLRLREENERRVCCLKLSSKTEGACTIREEYEVDAPDIQTGLAALLDEYSLDALKRHIAGQKLVEICRTEFVRKSFLLKVTSGNEICRGELAIDTGRLMREDRCAPLSELEFEYLDGSVSLFHIFAAKLEHTFHLEKQSLSKLARALAV